MFFRHFHYNFQTVDFWTKVVAKVLVAVYDNFHNLKKDWGWIDIFHACDSSIITFLELLLVYAVNSLSPSCNSSFFSDSLKIFSKNFFVSSGMMSSLDLDIVRRELRTELYSWRTLEVFLRNFPFDFGEFPPDPFPEHSWLQGQF